ncbi:Ig-like domain-containing protein [Methylomagnum sp.]
MNIRRSSSRSAAAIVALFGLLALLPGLAVSAAPLNHKPVAESQGVLVPVNGSLVITLQASDADGDRLKFSITAKPKKGKLKLVGAVATYTPRAKYVGTDQFKFVAKDRKAASKAAVIRIKVAPLPACTPPHVLQNNACVSPSPTCAPPQVLENGVCVTPPLTCTPPQVLQNGVCVTPLPTNQSPIANADINRRVEAGATVTLDGSQSRDPDGSIVAHFWEQTAGPVVALSNPAVASPSFTAPTVTQDTDLNFKLTVTDDRGSKASATVTITVSLPTADNLPPDKAQLIGVSSLSGDKLTAEWLAVADDRTTHGSLVYTLHVSEMPGFTPSSATAKLTQAGALNGTVEGLTPATQYYVKITATDGQGLESWSNELGIVTAGVIAQATPATVNVQDIAQAPQVTDTSVTYTGGGSAPKPGEYLASSVGEGYLRRVDTVRTQNGQVIATTQPASLNELFDTLEFNATVKLEPVPAQVPAALRASAHIQGGSTAPRQAAISWPETGLTLIDTQSTDASPAPRIQKAKPAIQAIAPKFARVEVNGDKQTSKGEYLDFTGPAFWALSPGQTGTFTLESKVARAKTSLLGKTRLWPFHAVAAS